MDKEKLPNKCDYCGLKQGYPPDKGTLFQDLKSLYDKEIIKQSFPRKIHAGGNDDRDEFCLVSSPAWKNTNSPCEEWQLLHPELSKSDYLSLNSAKKSIKSAQSTELMTNEIKKMTKLIVLLTVFTTITAVVSTCVAIDEKLNKKNEINQCQQIGKSIQQN